MVKIKAAGRPEAWVPIDVFNEVFGVVPKDEAIQIDPHRTERAHRHTEGGQQRE